MTDSPDRSHPSYGELRLLHALSLSPELLLLEHHPLTELGLVVPAGDTTQCLRLAQLFDAAPQAEVDHMADVCADLIDRIRERGAASREEDRDALPRAQAQLCETTGLALRAADALAQARDAQARSG
ncbi:MAG: hypothetical protein AB8I08_32965 [Sandaracinaceae bacterium]